RKTDETDRGVRRRDARASRARGRRRGEEASARGAIDQISRRARIRSKDRSGVSRAPEDPRCEGKNRGGRRAADGAEAGPGAPQKNRQRGESEEREDFRRDGRAEEESGEAKAAGVRRPDCNLRRGR